MTTSPDPPGKPNILRLSLTDRCNLRCRYCMPAQGVSFIPHGQLPSLEELAQAVAFAVTYLGVGRVKLTGGEPLVRRGVCDLVGWLAQLPGVDEVSMTTNGTLLASLARKLRAAGLARVNVSLDTLHPQRFRELTRGGDIQAVLAGILAAKEAGLLPVKLNAVLRASSWEEDVPQLISFATSHQLELRFIELMQTGTEAWWCQKEYVRAAVVQEYLQSWGRLEPLASPRSAPARRMLFSWAKGQVAVGFITPISHTFCHDCNRLRLDAQGRLRRCLMDPLTVPLVDLLRRGEEAALQAVRPYLASKRPPATMASALPMVAVGG